MKLQNPLLGLRRSEYKNKAEELLRITFLTNPGKIFSHKMLSDLLHISSSFYKLGSINPFKIALENFVEQGFINKQTSITGRCAKYVLNPNYNNPQTEGGSAEQPPLLSTNESENETSEQEMNAAFDNFLRVAGIVLRKKFTEDYVIERDSVVAHQNTVIKNLQEKVEEYALQLEEKNNIIRDMALKLATIKDNQSSAKGLFSKLLS